MNKSIIVVFCLVLLSINAVVSRDIVYDSTITGCLLDLNVDSCKRTNPNFVVCPSIAECIGKFQTMPTSEAYIVEIPAGNYGPQYCAGDFQDFNITGEIIFTSATPDEYASFNCGNNPFISIQIDYSLTGSFKFVFDNLNLTGYNDFFGGCISIRSSQTLQDASVYLYNVTTGPAGCRSLADGGLLYTTFPTVFIENSTISNCVAGSGGVVSADNANLYIYSSNFTNNNATGYFGGVASALQVTTLNSNYYSNGAISGGALYGINTAYIQNCSFTKNTAELSGMGGAVYASQTTVVFRSNFTSNSAGLAGALYTQKLSVFYSNFFGNQAFGSLSSGDAGAVYATDDVFIESCHFDSNFANSNGGALNVLTSSLSVHNSSFTFNTCGQSGGAVYISNRAAASNLKLVDNVFLYNHADLQGGAIASIPSYSSSINFDLTYSKFTGNAAQLAGGFYFPYPPNTIVGGVFFQSKSTQPGSMTFAVNSIKYINVANITNDLPYYNIPTFDEVGFSYWKGYNINGKCVNGIANIDENGNLIKCVCFPSFTGPSCEN
ncbi:hypothetical protein PPL_02380 [Heterostelium album PN500]|uniref:EGF-like domain-containing protein n=1 Tax=Heterostelium pallidum (strain ATCC 26659 / Pp 5 / PN500) TaxID=670386 RepID=D3AZJ8_HETP5|nr:hypothetical protein PPL_02380 [Heterostelium album PN500]EFA85377.1 hypothetical protein PPL_02380 [Heterostelium album PN500]|eukprot:XP_020437486.1 hypothetical protein PPL_02380 [Heterostelium album PN500]